jgi:hypothetical protein
MGFEAAKSSLGAIRTSLGVSCAVLLGDKVVAVGTEDAAELEALRAAAAGEVDKDLLLRGGGLAFFGRVSRVNESVAATKIALVIPENHQAARIYPLTLVIWTPSLAAGLLLALTMVVSRRDGKAS